MKAHLLIAAAMAVLALPALAPAQKVVYRGVPDYPTRRGSNRDVTIGYGPYPSPLPKDFNSYYYGVQNGYAVTPIVVPQPMGGGTSMVGSARPYTNEQYAQIVLQSIAASTGPAPARVPGRTLISQEEENHAYRPVKTRIADIMDRGLLQSETRENVRLRGVRMLSENDPGDFNRFYAREGSRTLRELIGESPVKIEFQEPLRDADGNLLGLVILPNGTELNKIILERGLGRYEPTDFPEGRARPELEKAAETARADRVGMYSR